MHTGYEKEVANLKQEAQQLLKTSVRIDNLFPHERDCRNGKTIARPSGRAGSSSQQTQQTPRGSNSNERNLTRKSEPTSNEREERPEMEISPQSGSERKGCPAFIFHSNKWPQIEITLFRVNIDFQNFFYRNLLSQQLEKKKTAIAFSGYVFYICIDILEPRKV